MHETTSSEQPRNSWNEAASRKLADTMLRLQAMGEMISWESIRRGMSTEDRAREKWLSDNHQAVYGQTMTEQAIDDDQGHLVLGDMSITQSAPAAPPPPSGSGWVIKALLGAGLLAAGVGLGVGAPIILDAFLNREAPAPPAGDADVQYSLSLDKATKE